VDFGSGGVAGSGSVVGGGKLVTDFTTSLDGLTVSGATWSNAGTITESGSGTLTLGGSASLVNVLGGVFDITGSGGIALTSAGGGSEHNFGTFEKTAGGASTVAGTFTNTGAVADAAGNLTFTGNFTNNGSVTVTSGGTLEFTHTVIAASGHSGTLSITNSGTLQVDSTVTSGETVSFGAGSNELLVLHGGGIGGFAASISGFPTSASGSDQIEIVGKTGLTDNYVGTAASGTLFVSSGATQIAALHLNGNYTSSTFTLTTSGGNTFITDPSNAAGSGPTYAFSDAGNGTETVTLAPAGQGVETVVGFSLAHPDVLDLAAVASAAGINLDLTNVGRYFDTTVSGGGTVLNFDPSGQGGGTPLAVLSGVNTNLQAMIDHNALKLS
jgi:hypothetical protein